MSASRKTWDAVFCGLFAAVALVLLRFKMSMIWERRTSASSSLLASPSFRVFLKYCNYMFPFFVFKNWSCFFSGSCQCFVPALVFIPVPVPILGLGLLLLFVVLICVSIVFIVLVYVQIISLSFLGFLFCSPFLFALSQIITPSRSVLPYQATNMRMLGRFVSEKCSHWVETIATIGYHSV